MGDFGEAVAALEGFEARAGAGARAAADAMADAFQREVRRTLLSRGHPRHTKTPAPPETPPAFISGNLARSVLNTPAVETAPATWTSKSGPTAEYSRIQELGGTMTAHSERGMRWQEPPGVWHKSMQHDLPARPYMTPTAEDMEASGELSEVAARAFKAVAG